MGKYHLDRLRKKYGWTGGTYSQLMRKIVEENSLSISRAIGRVSQDNFRKVASKISTKERRLVIPDISEAIPKRSVFTRKAAEKGKLLTDKLRDRLTKSLRKTVSEFSARTGEPSYVRTTRTGFGMKKKTGRVNPKLVEQFKQSIIKDFEGYKKVDPSYGVPPNIQTIAVTEVRSVADEIKYEYAKAMALQNSDNLRMTKKWIHNKSLSENPRPHHMAANGMTVGFYDVFELSNGAVLRYPHDPTADISEVASCHCDYDVYMQLLT